MNPTHTANTAASQVFAPAMLNPVVLALSLFFLAGCGGSPNPKEASKENFRRVLSGYLQGDDRRAGCMIVKRFPRSYPPEALMQAGLVAAHDTTNRHGRPKTQYRLTALGKEQQRWVNGVPLLCYGTPQMAEVTEFTDPVDTPSGTMSRVSYTYTIDLAGWTESQAVQERYGSIARWTGADAEPEETQAVLVLAGDGWVHQSEFSR